MKQHRNDIKYTVLCNFLVVSNEIRSCNILTKIAALCTTLCHMEEADAWKVEEYEESKGNEERIRRINK
jgi:hypothetical protein